MSAMIGIKSRWNWEVLLFHSQNKSSATSLFHDFKPYCPYWLLDEFSVYTESELENLKKKETVINDGEMLKQI